MQISKPKDIVENFIIEESSGHQILGCVNDEEKNQDDLVEVDSKRKHFLGVLSDEVQGKPSNSIITSATQILKEGEQQWLNSEVNTIK